MREYIHFLPKFKGSDRIFIYIFLSTNGSEFHTNFYVFSFQVNVVKFSLPRNASENCTYFSIQRMQSSIPVMKIEYLFTEE